MKNLTLDNITDAAVDSFVGMPHARHRELVQALVRHLHAYAREVKLSHAEWRAALAFLHRVGDISSAERSEFSLLSDVMGLSSLVDLLGSHPQATPGSVLGPFHTVGSPWKDNPANLIADNAGERVLLRGRVTGVGGQPLQEAVLDFWQNAANGLYWQLDPAQPRDNLRCQLRVDAQGAYEIATIRPVPYQIPTDGPAWMDLVQPAGRGSWRPAHFHVIVSAAGHRTLVTELFDAEDPYLDRDAVFGVREALIGRYVQMPDPAVAQRLGVAGPEVPVMRMDFRLAPA
jgi:catechol 1,2-dioxygenase/hydroxyquinol 1,2-dioxygenase